MPTLDVSAWANGAVTWKEVHALLHNQFKLPELKLPGVKKGDEFPLLPHKDARVEVRLQILLSGGSDLGFELEGEAVGLCIEVDLDLGKDQTIFGVMSTSRKGFFRFTSRFASLAALNDVFGGSSNFAGEATLEIFSHIRLDILKLLPQNNQLLTIHTGDTEGWIPVRFFATVAAKTASHEKGISTHEGDKNINVGLLLEMEIGQQGIEAEIFSLGAQLPGLVQAEPPIQMGITYIQSHFGIGVEQTDDSTNNSDIESQVEFGLEIHGLLHFRFPELPVEMKPILAYLEELPVFIEGAKGNLIDLRLPLEARLVIAVKDAESITLHLEIQKPSIDIDLFSMLSQLAVGLPEPESQSNSKAIPLDINFGFQFKGICLSIGQQSSQDAETFSLEIVLGANLGDCCVDGFFRISDRELKVGLKQMEVPILMPQFPLSVQDFADEFSEAEIKGIYHIIDNLSVANDSNSKLSLSQQKVAVAIKKMAIIIQNQINHLSGENVGEQRTHLYAKLALMSQILLLRGFFADQNEGRWNSENDRIFKAWLVQTTVAMSEIARPLQSQPDPAENRKEVVPGRLSLCHKLWLVLEDLVLRIPFNNPRNLGIQGSVHFKGFEAPFDVLNQIKLSAGISASMIYFQFDAAGLTIPFPDLGTPYKGGSLTIGEFRLGLGYTTRSFAFALAGELVLPEPLVDDLDTSDLIGVGIRLPVQSALNFKFDIMPIPLGKVVLLIPLFEFNIDLRKNFSPGISDTRICTPHWDGLQLIIQDLYHVSFKQLAYSLFHGPIPVENLRYDADFSIGNETNGFTLVIDEFHFYQIVYGRIPVPLIYYPDHPFCDNFCINLRLAGFSLNFNLQRPQPQFSPFALFEVFALLSDPIHYSVNPKGELANTLRATLRDAHIILPPNVQRLFPQVADRISKPLEITINLATYIQLIQTVMKFITPVAEKLFRAAQNAIKKSQSFQDLDSQLKADMTRLEEYGNSNSASQPFRPASPLVRAKDRPLSLRDLGEVSSVAELHQRLHIEFERLQEVSKQSISQEDFHRQLLERVVEAIGSILSNAYQKALAPTPELTHQLQSLLLTTIEPPLPDNIQQAIQQTVKNNVASALNALPPEFRKVRLEASFGGFEARAILLLITIEEAIQEFERRDQPAQRSQPQSFNPPNRDRPSDSNLIEAWINSLPNPPKGRTSKRLYDPEDSTNNLFAGRYLRDFEADVFEAITAIMSESAKSNAVMMAAYVNVFNFQYYQFLGYLAENGSFGLVTATKLKPLQLTVAGIDVALPLTIQGRLTLAGRAQRKGVTGQIKAEIQATWQLLGTTLEIKADDRHKTKPAMLSLASNGKFHIQGGLLINNLLGLNLKGQIDICETHATITNAAISYELGKILTLNISGDGYISSSQVMQMSIQGDLTLQTLTVGSLQGSLLTRPGEWQISVSASSLAPFRPLPFMDLTFEEIGISLKVQKDNNLTEFDMDGKGELKFWGAKIAAGAYRISYSNSSNNSHNELMTFIEGQLQWSNQLWNNARIEINNGGFTLCGTTSFTLGEAELPNLSIVRPVFRIDLQASLEFDQGGNLRPEKIELSGNWILGIQPAGDKERIIPLAINQFSIVNNTEKSKSSSQSSNSKHILLCELFNHGSLIIPKIDFDFEMSLPHLEIVKKDLSSLKLPGPKFTYPASPTTVDGWLFKQETPFPDVSRLGGVIQAFKELNNKLKQSEISIPNGIAFSDLTNEITINIPEDLRIKIPTGIQWNWNNTLIDLDNFPSDAKVVFDEKQQAQLQIGNAFRFPLPFQKVKGFALYLVWDVENKQIVVTDCKPGEGGQDYQPPFDKNDLGISIDATGERIIIRNNSDRIIDMGDWVIHDTAGHAFRIPPNFTLAAGAEVTVWTGSGRDDTNNLYWGRNQAVWNNTGDTLTLNNAQGAEVRQVNYSNLKPGVRDRA